MQNVPPDLLAELDAGNDEVAIFLFRVGKLQEITNTMQSDEVGGSSVTLSMRAAIKLRDVILSMQEKLAAPGVRVAAEKLRPLYQLAEAPPAPAVDEREAREFYTVLSTDPIRLQAYAPSQNTIDGDLAKRWLGVCDTLDEVAPGWHPRGGHALTCAQQAIREAVLSYARLQKVAPEPPPAWTGTTTKYNGYTIMLKRDFGNHAALCERHAVHVGVHHRQERGG